MRLPRSIMVIMVIVPALLLGGCYTLPLGPTVRVLPPPGKPFEVFQADDATCRQWAAQSTGANPSEAANQNLAGSAALGTLAGAGLGAATPPGADDSQHRARYA